MPSFADLPIELRDIIYEYSLIARYDHPSFPEAYPEHWILIMIIHRRKNSVLPCSVSYCQALKRCLVVALLGVNKSFGLEAAKVLYGKNVWRISTCKSNPLAILDLDNRW